MDEAFEKRLPKPEDLNAMTEESLKAAFAGESQAAEKYLVFAEQAEDEGFPNVAKLFRAISFAETRHARNHLRDDEGHRRDGRQPQDRLRGRVASRSTRCTPPTGDRQGAGEHAGRAAASGTRSRPRWTTSGCTPRRARRSSTARTSRTEPVSVCLICGHTVIGDVPDKCPVCAAAKEYYRTF